MVRTKGDNAGIKVVAAKAPRKVINSPASGGSSQQQGKRSDKYSGGNPYCPRPTPVWQKGIKDFLSVSPQINSKDLNEAGSSKDNSEDLETDVQSTSSCSTLNVEEDNSD